MFGKVTLDRPKFWAGEKFSAYNGNEYLDLWPRHARLQNMTYSARIMVETHIQVYTKKLVSSDEFKTGAERFVHKECVMEEKRDVMIGRIPVMVNSELCWMSGANMPDCEFDHGGYFIVKGAEKTFIAQEQICLKSLWVSDNPTWMVAYRAGEKRNRVYLKLTETLKIEHIKGEEKGISVYFLAEMPIWVCFFIWVYPLTGFAFSRISRFSEQNIPNSFSGSVL